MVAACGRMHDAVVDGALHHRGQPAFDDAVSIATRRSLAGAWAWQRGAAGDVAPLVSGTLAVWGLQEFGHGGTSSVEPFAIVT